ncbi:hypothetical protein C1H46_017913 [Malus baccata]|uniref:Trehalase n=1 Tax=Malus baccata TaxID=106549 RepID=A0A540MCG5_MALBA|nr:hypothetical protein C1H46_017913 [Malus baccata]
MPESRFPNCDNSSPFPFLSSLLFLLLVMTTTTVAKASTMTGAKAPPPCVSDSGPVKPTTPLVAFLEKLQETALATLGKKDFDPKYYVDLSLKLELPATQKAFDQLPRSAGGSVSAKDLKEYVDEYFGGAGEDMVVAEPVDFVPEPEGFLPKVKHPEVRAWALEVHSLWKNLSRKVCGGVHKKPELHTLLPLPEQFVIPGSRFREVYYWDSYWVIRGLLASKMYDTAKNIVTNLLSLIEEYGYVLNGARTYYANRSQPPLLSAMVHEIYKRTGDVELARKALPALMKEHEFWNSGIHKVIVQDSEAQNHTLSRYYAMWNTPRPESSTIMEHDIAFLAKVTGDSKISERFLKASEARHKAIKAVFWDAKKGQWLDYWLNRNTCNEEDHTWEACNQNQNVYASNFVPLWLEPFYSDASVVEKVTKSLRSSGLIYPAGIATSLTNSTQQWDFPNGWAPLQHMIVEGLLNSGLEEAKSTAEDIAVRWIRTNYVAFQKTHTMHEKYDVRECGATGGGGEYIPQVCT